MNHVGYGVTKNGEPCGIWPSGWVTVQRTLARYRANDTTHSEFAIVPLYTGAPISVPLVREAEHA